ncbi:MAG: hypothetical protein U0031_06810 [Thermomicrobiales bacterium]
MHHALAPALSRIPSRSASRRGILALIAALGVAGRFGTRGALGAEPGQPVTASPTSATADERAEFPLPALVSRWWAWISSRDFTPLTTSGVVHHGAGEDDDVGFLAGSLYDVGPVTRICTVPSGTRLFFPVVSGFCAERATASATQRQELDACAATFVDLFAPDDLSATRDGVPVPITRAAGDRKTVELAASNPFGAPPGDYLQQIDGYWVLLDPLTPGDHILHFAAAPVIDVTYHLTVG